MGTIRRLTDLYLGSIGSTKILSITTSETAYTISRGYRAFEAFNPGNSNVFYGQSNLSVNSGIMISSSNGSKFWDSVTDQFTMYFRINSGGISNQLIIHEYRGNDA